MTAVADSEKSDNPVVENGEPSVSTDEQVDLPMPDVKDESALAKPQNPDEADADSEAETWIQSPEKKRTIVDGAPSLPPIKHTVTRSQDDIKEATAEAAKKSRKRKREIVDGENRASSPATSSPLSSPHIGPHDRESDSDASNRSAPRSAKTQRHKRNAGLKAESEGEGSVPAKMGKRRPSDIIPAKHRSKASGNSVDAGNSERRETRSATFTRQSSEERSPSPRPSSRRDHRRHISTQITAGDVERKVRGRPPKINTRRNRSLDRAQSASSDSDSSSPATSRPHLPKYASHDQDNMSPAKVAATGVRKYRDKNGRTFLARAANNNDLEKARICFLERPEDLNVPDNAGNTPLQIAALEGYSDIVKFLLENGADFDCRNIDKETPLIDSVENSHFEVVELLLKAGANPRLGNAKGDEPYELVPQDDENYEATRKLIARAKDGDFKARRKFSDNTDPPQEGSTPAASAASPRDSPPIMGLRSPPPAASRRRTGRSESTRNDLLWQANDQPSLKRLAAQGHVQGVAQILNVLNKAETPAVIAAAKAGHEEVLQLMLAMGDADPDPDPILSAPKGWNTPMLAAIGRGNLDVIKLLVETNGFDATRRHDGKTYYEIAEERKGAEWEKEYKKLKEVFDSQSAGGKRKNTSPRKQRDQDQASQKKQRRSASPASNKLRNSSSPAMAHKALPGKSPRLAQKERRLEEISSHQRERRRADSSKKNADAASVAVASDQDQSVKNKAEFKHRRSHSDVVAPADSEGEVSQRRRRLVTGKEHRRRKSTVGEDLVEASDPEPGIKPEKRTPGLKRTRNSASPEAGRIKDDASNRLAVKKRRTVPESSPEESRPEPKRKAAAAPPDSDMADAKRVLGDIDEVFKRKKQRHTTNSDDASKSPLGESEKGAKSTDSEAVAGTGNSNILPTSESASPEFMTPAEQPGPEAGAEESAPLSAEEEARKAAEEARVAAEAVLLREKEAAEQEAAIKLAAEKEAAEEAAAREAALLEAQRAAEEAEAKRKAEEEAAEAKRKADEEAAIKKREEEERQERQRREQIEERKRRHDEQVRLRELEAERRRREKLPAALCRCALMLDTQDPYYYTPEWMNHFLPLFTVKTIDLNPDAPPAMYHEEWIPNFQVACLLATKDLALRNLTSLEKYPATAAHVDRLWKVARLKLAFDYESNSLNTSIAKANEVEDRERPKFFQMENEIFWVKLPEVLDYVARSKHLAGLTLGKKPISLKMWNPLTSKFESPHSSAHPSPQPNGFVNHSSPLLTNGASSHKSSSPVMPYTNGASMNPRT